MPDGFFVDTKLYEEGEAALARFAQETGERLMSGLAKARDGMIQNAIAAMTRAVGADASIAEALMQSCEFTGSHRDAYQFGVLRAIHMMQQRAKAIEAVKEDR